MLSVMVSASTEDSDLGQLKLHKMFNTQMWSARLESRILLFFYIDESVFPISSSESDDQTL
jgi:hypothetical protein